MQNDDMENDNQDLWIEHLAGRVQGSLSVKDKKQAELLRNVILQQTESGELDVDRVAELKKRIQNKSRFMTQGKTQTRFKSAPYAVAASFLCALGLTSWITFQNDTHPDSVEIRSTDPVTSSSIKPVASPQVFVTDTEMVSDRFISQLKQAGGHGVITDRGDDYIVLFINVPDRMDGSLVKLFDEYGLSFKAGFNGSLTIKKTNP